LRSWRAISTGSPVRTSFAAIEDNLVLRRSDLCFDDFDGEFFLVAAGEPGGAIPNARGALAGIYGAKNA
jgi:hypothetical protein